MTEMTEMAVIGSFPVIANVECEAAILGGMMIDNRTVESIADKISAADFYEPVHGRIFDAILAHHAQGRPANPATLRPLFEADEAIKTLGGAGYLAQLTGSSAALIGLRDFAEQIAFLSRRRRLADELSAAVQLAADLEAPDETVIEMADAALADATETDSAPAIVSAGRAARAYLDSLDQPQRPGIVSRIIPELDEAMGDIRPGNFVVGAGRPGMGKTAAALSYSLGAAQGGHGVLFVSLEMGADELCDRMIADLCFNGRGGVHYKRIRDHKLGMDDMRQVADAAAMLDDLPLYILDAANMTIARLDRHIRRMKRKLAAKGQSLDLLIVDYLQLIRPDRRGANRFETVTETSIGLKGIAKEHGLAVFALSQLSREVEKRVDKRPIMADLRESGQVEQDADAILFFFRPEYYLRQNEPKENSAERFEWEAALRDCAGVIEFIAAKRRSGESGVTRRGTFHLAFQAVR